MDLKSLSLLFSAGDLTQAEIVPEPLPSGKARHIVLFTRKNGSRIELIDSRGKIKAFSSVKTACESVAKIGFKSVVVALPPPPTIPKSENFELR